MIRSEEAVAAALAVARNGLDRGEMPIGAVIFSGDELLASAFTQEQAQWRRIVHADLLAMEEADRALGFRRPSGSLFELTPEQLSRLEGILAESGHLKVLVPWRRR